MNAKDTDTRDAHCSKALFEGAGCAVCRAAEMETLQAFLAPANARKPVHRLHDRQHLPDVEEL